MLKVAVTGGTGCIGRSLVRMLLNSGFAVNVLTRNPIQFEKSEKDINVYVGSITSYRTLFEFTADCDVVFHLAGKVHSVPRTTEEEQDFFRINVGGTKKLLKASKANEVSKFVFFSTVGVYGHDSNFHGDEFSECNPQTAYASSKLEAEKLVLKSNSLGGPAGVVLRLPVVYGPGDRGNVAQLIQAVRNHLFVYFGKGDSLRSMISSNNAAHAGLRAAIESGVANQVFCVTDGRDYTLNEIVSQISLAIGSSWQPWHVALALAKFTGKFGDMIERMVGVPTPLNSSRVRKLSEPLTFSNTKSEIILGYRPIETLEEGIRNEVEWLTNV